MFFLLGLSKESPSKAHLLCDSHSLSRFTHQLEAKPGPEPVSRLGMGSPPYVRTGFSASLPEHLKRRQSPASVLQLSNLSRTIKNASGKLEAMPGPRPGQ